MSWEWNGAWDEEQVAEFLPAFEIEHAKITARGEYPYNDSFLGLIPGIAGEYESRAIYLLQGLRRKRAQQVRVAELVANGYAVVDALSGTTKYRHVVLVPTSRMGGEWAEYEEARIVPIEEGKPAYVIPKGKRTRGTMIAGRMVLAQ
jgi:hypothetical protein